MANTIPDIIPPNEVVSTKKLDLKLNSLLKELHSVEGKIADSITAFSGSMSFVYFHIVWFTLWIVINYGLLKDFIPPFDPFPYGLLTMVVSLEAIFLATFIMITQNRQALIDTYRELEEEKEQIEEEQQQEELEDEVEDIQQDLDHIKEAISLLQQKISTTKQPSGTNGNNTPIG